MKKFDYIVCFYFGPRRTASTNYLINKDKFIFFHRHLRFVNTLEEDAINDVYFVFNDCHNDVTKRFIENCIERSSKKKINVIYRGNEDFSYGGWNQVLSQSCKTSTAAAAYIGEDDYLPTTKKFYESFLSKLWLLEVGHEPPIPAANTAVANFKTCFVCQLWNAGHAAISNGFISYEACRKILDRHGNVLNLNRCVNYATAEQNQVNFLNFFTKEDYKVTDINAEKRNLFLNHASKIITYGPVAAETVLEPVNYSDFTITFDCLEEKDLSFLNMVRNFYCEEYLHNPTNFSLDQTRSWFLEQKPSFFNIKLNNENIGYFRTSNRTDDTIYIGADIHPEYVGKGYGYLSYHIFIDDLFEKTVIKTICLEVLETNTRAINLYKKLGFVEKSAQTILRNNKEVKSIFMSLSKEDWVKRQLSILIILFYYNRPNMVKNALTSIRESTYKKWKLAFIDDGSQHAGDSVVRSMFNEEELSKTIFMNTNDTKEKKLERKGSLIGKFANDAMATSGCNLCIMLCDDDALVDSYLLNLNLLFSQNGWLNYCYSHVIHYNPAIESYKGMVKTESNLNHETIITPACNVDASQVAWRPNSKIQFAYPLTSCLDSQLYSLLHKEYGLCHYSRFDGQYKGVHAHQLGRTGSYDIVD